MQTWFSPAWVRALEIYSRYSRVETPDGSDIGLQDYLAKVWEVVGREALEQVLGMAEPHAKDSAAGALEEDARLTALFLWTMQNAEDTALLESGEEGGAEEGGSQRRITTNYRPAVRRG